MGLPWFIAYAEVQVLLLGMALLLIVGTVVLGPFGQPPLMADIIGAVDLVRSHVRLQSGAEPNTSRVVIRSVSTAGRAIRFIWTAPEILGFLPSVWFWILQVSLVTGIPLLYGWKYFRSAHILDLPSWSDASWPAELVWLLLAGAIVWTCLGPVENRVAELMRELHPSTRRYLGSERDL